MDGASRDESPNLSTLPEVCSQLEVLRRSVENINLFNPLELDIWKLQGEDFRLRDVKPKNKEITSTYLSVSQWNSRSLNSEYKTRFVQSLFGEVVAIQEIWQRFDNAEKIGELIGKSTRLDERGGGSATVSKTTRKIQLISEFKVNKDSHAVKLRIEGAYVWLINLYLHKGCMRKIQKAMGIIKKEVPENEWKIICCLGDFNVDVNTDSQEFRLLNKVCKMMGLTVIKPSKPTRSSATLDFMITGRNIEAKEHSMLNGPSDHRAINWELRIRCLQKKKPIKIPSKPTATMISTHLLDSKRVCDARSFIQELELLQKKHEGDLWMLVRTKATRNDELMKLLLELDRPEQIDEAILNYWKKFWESKELERYSEGSAAAYQTFKKVLKYHLFEKRDGGIINCIKREDQTIEYDQDKVNEMLLQTMKEIQIDDRWKFIEEKEFPKLPIISEESMEKIISELSVGKAIAYDGVSDVLFTSQENEKEVSKLKITARKLRNLWRVPLHKLKGMQKTWDTRLVPLNKVFPNVPTRKELRPIAIQSALVKTLECRFLEKLQEYLNTKLDRSQTGFIQKLGIQVNLVRALERIRLRTVQNKVVYGLFIDFSNAYNSIPHELLFAKLRLKKVLDEEEIQFIEQLYARYRLRIGKAHIRSNKGVAQGSVISPALFNIFIEDLSEELKRETGLSLEDILYYADDLLVICSSIEQVRKIIHIISKWSEDNGMELNKKKSGIVVFGGRRKCKLPMMTRDKSASKKGAKSTPMNWKVANKFIEGIPVCEKYKYLGTILTPKLTCGEQISYIKRKTGFIFVKLYPYLSHASADARRDMWQTMIRPLFNAAMVLLEYEPSATQKENLMRVWRGTFKQFMIIKKRTPDMLVNEMINCDLEEAASQLVVECKAQWEQRKRCEKVKSKLRAKKRSII